MLPLMPLRLRDALPMCRYAYIDAAFAARCFSLCRVAVAAMLPLMHCLLMLSCHAIMIVAAMLMPRCLSPIDT